MNYVTSIEKVLWGITLAAIMIAIHGCRMLATLYGAHCLTGSSEQPASFVRGGTVLIVAIWMIVLVHLTELLIRAAFFLWQNVMPSPSASYYFALMQCITVGGDYSLPLRWRPLDGVLPMAGLMTFAWSSGVLFAMAQEFQNVQLGAIYARRRARRAQREASRRSAS